MANYNNNTLEYLAGISFPANNLITCQLVHVVENFKPNQYVDLRPKYFAMFSLIPGVGSEANRSYEFQNSIAIKFSILELKGLAEVLYEVAKSNIYVLPYIKFAKNNGVSKSVSIIHNTKENKFSPHGKEAFINIIVSETGVNGSDKQKTSVTLSPSQAFGFSAALNNLADKGMQLDMDRQLNAPRQQNSNQKQQYNNTVVLNTAPNSIPGPNNYTNSNIPQPVINYNDKDY